MKNAFPQEIKDELKEIVINKLLKQVEKFYNLAMKYEKENQILKLNIIDNLKNIFLIKSQYNISVPLRKVMKKQNMYIKNKITELAEDTFLYLNNLKTDLNKNSSLNSYNKKIITSISPCKITNNNISERNKSNRRNSSTKSIYRNNNSLSNLFNSNNSINLKNDYYSNNSKIYSLNNIDKDESINSIKIYQNKNLNDENSIKKNYQKPQLNINNCSNNSTSSNSIFKLNKPKIQKNNDNNNNKKKVFKRDVSLPKLPLKLEIYFSKIFVLFPFIQLFFSLFIIFVLFSLIQSFLSLFIFFVLFSFLFSFLFSISFL